MARFALEFTHTKLMLTIDKILFYRTIEVDKGRRQIHIKTFLISVYSFKMDLDNASLRQVFDALDEEQKGHITVDQFTGALEQFYASSAPSADNNSNGRPKLTRMPSVVRFCFKKEFQDVRNIVTKLDPERDGIISFDDFKQAFQNLFSSSGMCCFFRIQRVSRFRRTQG